MASWRSRSPQCTREISRNQRSELSNATIVPQSNVVRNLSESTIRAVQCYDCPTKQCGETSLGINEQSCPILQLPHKAMW